MRFLHKSRAAITILPIAAALLVAGCYGAVTQPPATKVIQVCDWHYVPKDLFAADMRSTPGKSYNDEEIDQLYAAHLDDVEAVQQEQIKFLRELIRQHNLFDVWVEGLTLKKKPGFLDLVDQTKAVEQDQIPQLKGNCKRRRICSRKWNQRDARKHQSISRPRTTGRRFKVYWLSSVRECFRSVRPESS